MEMRKRTVFVFDTSIWPLPLPVALKCYSDVCSSAAVTIIPEPEQNLCRCRLNLTEAYQDVETRMIKSWNRLPIALHCACAFFFTRGPKSSQGSGLSQDILFPDGEMFLAFRLCPGVLPMALETLEGKVGVCTECVSEIKVAGKETQ